MRWAKDSRCRISGGYWRCDVKVKEFDRSEKGVARHHRHETKRIQVRVGVTLYSYRIPPERKSELMERLAQFRASQSTERREAENGWIDQAVA